MKKKIQLSLNKKTISNLNKVRGGEEFIEGDVTIGPTASRKPDNQSACLCGPTTDPNHTYSCQSCEISCGMWQTNCGGYTCPNASLDGC